MSVTEWSALVTALTTVVYTIGTFMLWKATTKTTILVEKQVTAQVQSGHSIAHHSVIDGHRDLFLEIIKDETLLRIFAAEVQTDPNDLRKKYLASIMINHVLRVFLDFKRNVALDTNINSFDADAKDLFSLPFVKARWHEVKQFHPELFRNYIDSRIVAET